MWCWLIGCTLFLSASQSKLVTYLWPVFPAVAILAAVAWVRLLEGALSPPARRSILLTFWLSSLGGVVLPPAAMLVVESRFGARFDWPVWTVIVVVAAGAWLPLWVLRTGRLGATLVSSLLAVVAQYVAVMALLVPTVAASTSALELARYFNRLGRVPPRVLVIEERLGSLVFYLEPELRAGLQEGQFEEVRLKDWSRLPWSASGAVVALPERQARRAAGYFDLDGVPYRRAGRYRIYAVSQLESRTLAAAGGAGSAGR